MRVIKLRVTNFGLAATILVCAVLLGGGNANFPVQRMIVELAGVIVLAMLAWRGWRGPTDRWTMTAMAFFVAMLTLGLIQLVPLPAAWWQALPGRALPADSARTIGADSTMMPLSLAPDATIRGLLFLIPPLAMAIATLACSAAERRRLFGWTIGLGLFSAFLGIFQTASGSPYIYAISNQDSAVGLFSNHNHQADFLLISMLLMAAAAPRRARTASWPLVAGGLVGFLAIAVIATMSRAGVVLLVPTLLGCIALLVPAPLLRDRRILAIGGAATVVLLGVAALLSRNAMVIRTLDRFDADSDPRFMFWPHVLRAVARYFPAGSGLGSFVPIFKAVEPLGIINRTYVVHAHNDYLEIILEAGLAGAIFLLLFMILVVTGIVRAWRDPARADRRSGVIITGAAIAILLIHSLVDYPLRTINLASLLAMLLATLAPSPVGQREMRARQTG